MNTLALYTIIAAVILAVCQTARSVEFSKHDTQVAQQDQNRDPR